ncbi:MAG: GNAT family N-acetyltransferase [Bacteroidia bacterium]|nr:GNAT family N-acetyltransferase [Bacteroidia bacterium]
MAIKKYKNKCIIIRDFTNEDFPGVLELWVQTGMGGKHRGDDEKVIARSIQSGGRLLVMEETARKIIIGTSWLTNDARRLYLHHFGILPDYQGKGLSKLLMKESLKFAKEKGLQTKLEVHKDNFKAINLYQRTGFKYLGDYDVYIVREHTKI